MRLEVIGVYPVKESEQPCYLIELRVSHHHGPLDIGSFYQPPRKKNGNEQVAYGEYVLNSAGTAGTESFEDIDVDGDVRLAFFVHFLQDNWRLATPTGIVQLPIATPKPDRLSFIEYHEP
jgi:hypothetical protein